MGFNFIKFCLVFVMVGSFWWGICKEDRFSESLEWCLMKEDRVNMFGGIFDCLFGRDFVLGLVWFIRGWNNWLIFVCLLFFELCWYLIFVVWDGWYEGFWN